MDMGESALWGDTESLCCSSDPTPPPPSTQGSCSDAGSLGGDTTKIQKSNNLLFGYYQLISQDIYRNFEVKFNTF